MTNPTTPTDDKAERKRCANIASEIIRLVDDGCEQDVKAVLLRELAAARREGEAVGYEEGVAAAKEDAWHEGYREADALWRKNTSSDATVFAKQGAQLTRLTEAARAFRHDHMSTTGRVAKALDAALAQALSSAADGEGVERRNAQPVCYGCNDPECTLPRKNNPKREGGG